VFRIKVFKYLCSWYYFCNFLTVWGVDREIAFGIHIDLFLKLSVNFLLSKFFLGFLLNVIPILGDTFGLRLKVFFGNIPFSIYFALNSWNHSIELLFCIIKSVASLCSLWNLLHDFLSWWLWCIEIWKWSTNAFLTFSLILWMEFASSILLLLFGIRILF
jgi:hypothetical protein